MKAITILVIALLTGAFVNVKAQEDTSEAFKKAQTLFEKMNMRSTYDQIIDVMLAQEVKQYPAAASYTNEMKSFFQKYIGWDAIKNDLAAIYAGYFTANEIDELITFYSTPTGQKMLLKLPDITQKSMQLASSKLTPHLEELTKIIQEKADKATPAFN
jgi:hypothetical protein